MRGGIPILILLGSCFFLTTLFECRERVVVAASLVTTFFRFSRNAFMISLPLPGSAAWQEKLAQINTDSAPIPKIIHQVKLGGLPMRPAWNEAKRSCQQLHPTWEFRLWEDEEAFAFVKQHYSDIFNMYQSYTLEIQRSNVLRYLLLDYYGGIYFDLDLDCHQSLDLLRNETFLTPPANPTGVNNAFIISSAHHPFWTHLRSNLLRYDKGWYFPYLTNMFSTGCHFFSTMHRTYPHQAALHILDNSHKLNGHVTTPLFEHLGASSWHQGDARLFLQLGRAVEYIKHHLLFSIFLLMVATLLPVACLRHRHHGHTKRLFDLEQSKHEYD